MIRVLLLGAGGAAGNSVARCLTRAEGFRTVGANCDPMDLALAETDERHLIPRADDEGWTDAVLDLIERTKPDAVHAQPEQEVLLLSAMRERVPGGHLMPTFPDVWITQDKWALYEAWKAAGLTVPETRLLSNVHDLVRAMSELGEVWLRATGGAGGSGSLRTGSFGEARFWVMRHAGWGNFTAAAVLQPETVVFQSLWRDGEMVVGQSKRRLRWANARNVPSGIGGSAAISETCSDPIISRTAIRAIRAVTEEPHGILNVDMALDSDGVPNPTEINAGRFNTTVDFFAAAGLNLPALHFSGGSVAPPVTDPLGDGLLWIRAMDRPPMLTSREMLPDWLDMPLEVVA